MVDPGRRPLALVHCGWPRDRQLVAELLGTMGVEVRVAEPFADVRRLLAEDRVDLILADSAVGQGSLAAFLGTLDGHAEAVDLPMVLLADPADLNELAARTARRFNAVLLTKPVVREQLAAAIEAGLKFRARYRQVRDLLRQLEASNLRLASANTELERRREEAAEEARRKTRFLSAISHDIRTPVNAMILTCELLQHVCEGDPDRGEVRELARVLRANAGALTELVNDLLDIARYDQGKLEFTESDFALGEFIETVTEGLRPLAAEKALALQAVVETRAAVVRTDRVKLGRVLQNLVANAIKFTDEGSVRVVARAGTAEGLVLTVEDTGVGIPDSMREGIFDEFAQLRNPERDRTKGTGLGLSICRRLLGAMGGSICVDDPGGRRGSTFRVVLGPSRVVDDGPGAVPSERGRSRSGEGTYQGRVLVVDDHEPSRIVTRRLLQWFGLEVDVAANGRDALAKLNRSPPDLMLLDLMMPEMGGAETLGVIRSRPEWADLPVVILTGDVGERAGADLARAGATSFLSKPLDVRQLTALLDRYTPPVRGGRDAAP